MAPEESISGLQGGGRGPLRIPGHQNHIFQELQSSKSMFHICFLSRKDDITKNDSNDNDSDSGKSEVEN